MGMEARAAISPTSPTSSRARCGRLTPKASAAGSSTSLPSSPISVSELAETIGRILGKDVRKEFAPPRAGDIRDSWADISAARQALGWEPSVGLEEGLQRTVEALVG